MPFDRDSITTIVKRIEKGIEARLFGRLALLRTAVLRILARVFAGAIHGCYGYLEWLKNQLFVTTAEEWFLINVHGVMWGITRRPGSFASGTVIFTGVDGIVIPADTRLQNEDGIEYGTTIPGTITGGVASIDVQAIETGDDGNYIRPNPPDPIYLQLISPITNVDDQTEIDGDITGGEDIEDLEVYRSRILQRIRTTPAGGNAADYDRWATSYPGVSRAWCYPIASGPGTVTEIITATGDDPVPSSTLLAEVQAYMDVLRPVTADLTVASITDYFNAPGKTVLGFSIDLYEDTSGSEYQEAIKDNLRTLFLPHKPGTTIPISQVRAAISNSGVTDYRINTINADGIYLVVDDIALTGYQYPWLGSVNFGVL
jgi:uncharacterized phage protein gp47/JayE